MKKKMFKIGLYSFLLSGITGIAQEKFSSEFYTYKDKYPDSHFVRLNQETNVTLELKGDQLEITQNINHEDLYLDEAATYGGSKGSVNFSSFFELDEIEAASYIYQNNKYKEVKVQAFKEKDELNHSFYDDSKTLNFIYPQLEKGSKSRLTYSEKVKNPRFLSPFYFGDYFPVVNNKFSITADKDIALKFKLFNAEGLDIKFSQKEKRGNNIYTWELQNMPKFDFEESSPTYQSILPHIVPILTSYKVNDSEVKMLNSEEDLYNWYYSLVKDINKEKPSQGLVDVVNSLTADKETDLEKVKAIYYWAQQNIKYIAFEYALGGFIPREANSIYDKKYGDCKDNSSILLEMLEIAGLQGNLTWIGTRNIMYSYKELPTPLVDNHMILSYVNNEKTYYLDATGRYLPIGLPSSFIQGKEALISHGENDFEIKKVPVVEAEVNSFKEKATIQLEGENIVGTATAIITGYNKVDYFQYLEMQDNRDKEKEFYNSIFQLGNNGFLVKDYEEINKYSYDEDFIVNYSFNIQNYAKKLGDEIYINLNLNKETQDYKVKKDRKNIVEMEYKRNMVFETVLEIPAGYQVEYLPENIQVENNFFSSAIFYEQKEHSIVYKHSMKLNYLQLNIEQQKQLNKLIDQVEKAYKEIVILKKM